MRTNDDTVRLFCDAFARMDADELIGYFTDDCVYHNIPLAPLRGRDQVRNSFAQLRAKFEAIEFETLHQLSRGDMVMNERIDYMVIQGARVALPVMGVFELREGKIAAWRDYFDLAQLKRGPA